MKLKTRLLNTQDESVRVIKFLQIKKTFDFLLHSQGRLNPIKCTENQFFISASPNPSFY